jgi:hypothetical protein
MVISEDEAAALHPSIALHITCNPSGTGVFINNKKVGVAPGDIEWTREAGGNSNRQLIVQLRHPGFAPHTSKYPADTKRIDLDVTLLPRAKPAEAAAPANEGDTSSASGEATSDDDSESSDDTESETESADPPAPPSPEP